MKDAIHDADRDGASIFLSASDAGRALYLKYGFEDVEVRFADFRDKGARGARNTTVMIRKVRVREG